MKKTFSSVISLILVLSIFFILPNKEVRASVGVPYFGGMVTLEYTCNTGLLLYVKEAVSLVPPVFTIIPYMWLWGELPFLSHVPPHPGQEILGVASPTAVPCVLGYIPIGAGFPILYHGSSL